MDKRDVILWFWNDVADQNAVELKNYFTSEAIIRWHDTNEKFNVSEYIIANCEYPGEWSGEVERIEVIGDLAISVTRVWSSDGSFHATSFFQFEGDKIIELDEYWGNDGIAPKWRLDKHIGCEIN